MRRPPPSRGLWPCTTVPSPPLASRMESNILHWSSKPFLCCLLSSFFSLGTPAPGRSGPSSGITLAISLCLEVLPRSSLGCLLVSLRCRPLRGPPNSASKVLSFLRHYHHHPHSLRLPVVREALSDFPSWVKYCNVHNCSRVTLFIFHAAHVSLKFILFIR